MGTARGQASTRLARSLVCLVVRDFLCHGGDGAAIQRDDDAGSDFDAKLAFPCLADDRVHPAGGDDLVAFDDVVLHRGVGALAATPRQREQKPRDCGQDDDDDQDSHVVCPPPPFCSRSRASRLYRSKTPRSIASRARRVSSRTKRRLWSERSRSPRSSSWFTRCRMYARLNAGAGRAVAVGVERARVAGEAGVPQVEPALPGERAAGAGGAGREDAVEHVDAGLDRLEDPLGVADSHEVAGLLGREERREPVGRLEHQRAVLADREPADRVAVEVELAELLERSPAQLAVGAALDDREAKLALGARSVALAAGPLGGAPHGVVQLDPRHAGRRHLVEAHRDVAAEVRLDRGGELRREPRLGAVVDVAERHAVVVDARDRVASENTWKPPESVRIGRFQAMKRCRPPSSAIVSSPGRKCRW